MITNATLLRIDTPAAAPTATGKRPLAEGASIDVRCAIDAVGFRQRRELGVTIEDATAVVYLQGVAVARGCRLLTRRDGEAGTEMWSVVGTSPRAKGGISHVEAFVQGVSQ